MSHINSFAGILTIACCLLSPVAVSAQEGCSAALQDIRNNLISSSNTVSKEVYKRYFYHLTSREAYSEYSRVHDSSNDSSGMFKVTIPIDDVPVTPEGSGSHGEKLSESEFNKRFETWKDTVRDKIESERFYSESNYYNESRINNASIEAWERCMSQGLFAYASRSDADTVMLRVFWKTNGTQSARLSFVTPTRVTVEAKPEDLTIHGSHVFKVTGDVKEGFAISVNGAVVDMSGAKVQDIDAFDVKVGPAVLAKLPEGQPIPVDRNADLRNLQQEFSYKDFPWNGDWPRHQIVLRVFDSIPQHRGERILYTIKINSYYNLHSYFYQYKIFVNDKEDGVIQNNNYSEQPHPIGEDPKSYDGELIVPADGRVDIRVECVSFDTTIRQVGFGIYNGSIKTKFK